MFTSNHGQAHQYASNAEDFVNQGLFIPAAEEHHKSAQAFLQCVDHASDEGTKRTLRMLYNEHNKAGKELQRKITKLQEEGKDPSLPQHPSAHSRERRYTSPTSGTQSTLLNVTSRGLMADSNHTIDESYMVLGQQSDPRDTFNQFWRDLEGMLDNLSQPVAFATAPLTHHRPSQQAQGSHSGVLLVTDRPPRQRQSSGSDEIDFHTREPSIVEQSGQVVTNSTTIKAESQSDASDPEEVMADEDFPSEESFFMVPSTSNSFNKLRRENESLKLQIAALQHKFDIAERMRVEQEEQLHERVSNARREAQRVKNSGFLPARPLPPSIALSSLNVDMTTHAMFSPHVNRDREAQLVRQFKEREEEIKTLRLENDKQKAMIIKFRERWEKLKESAKRKRNAKINAGVDNNVRDQRIDEEPEGEVEDDGDTSVARNAD
ncbi:hypothetical protein K439DRAFT_1403658 [Ramaria rubella]|nr:hypothetical protein K439DRAFT_1403658 [Ramaria rubella]